MLMLVGYHEVHISKLIEQKSNAITGEMAGKIGSFLCCRCPPPPVSIVKLVRLNCTWDRADLLKFDFLSLIHAGLTETG